MAKQSAFSQRRGLFCQGVLGLKCPFGALRSSPHLTARLPRAFSEVPPAQQNPNGVPSLAFPGAHRAGSQLAVLAVPPPRPANGLGARGARRPGLCSGQRPTHALGNTRLLPHVASLSVRRLNGREAGTRARRQGTEATTDPAAARSTVRCAPATEGPLAFLRQLPASATPPSPGLRAALLREERAHGVLPAR